MNFFQRDLAKKKTVKMISTSLLGTLCAFTCLLNACQITSKQRKTPGISHLESELAKTLYNNPSHSSKNSSNSLEKHYRTEHYQNKIAVAARDNVGKKRVRFKKQSFRGDCSGTVRGIYKTAGVTIPKISSIKKRENDVSIIYRSVQQFGNLHQDTPQIGDFVFFDNSYDRNKDGRLNDKLTHIAVVEKIDTDSTIWIVHHASGRVLRYAMNLKNPTQRKNSYGKRINHFLRRKSRFPAATAAELFVAFGSLKMPLN